MRIWNFGPSSIPESSDTKGKKKGIPESRNPVLLSYKKKSSRVTKSVCKSISCKDKKLYYSANQPTRDHKFALKYCAAIYFCLYKVQNDRSLLNPFSHPKRKKKEEKEAVGGK